MKGTKIFNLNLLKFDCQKLPFRRSLASSTLNPFLFPQELKFNLETTSKTIDHSVDPKPRLGVILQVCFLGGKGEFKRDTAWNLRAVWCRPVTSYVVSWAQSRLWVINDNQDSFSFVDKTGPTVTTDVKSNTEWNMKGSS